MSTAKLHESLGANGLLSALPVGRSTGAGHREPAPADPGQGEPTHLTRHARQDGTRISYLPPADADGANADC